MANVTEYSDKNNPYLGVYTTINTFQSISIYSCRTAPATVSISHPQQLNLKKEGNFFPDISLHIVIDNVMSTLSCARAQ